MIILGLDPGLAARKFGLALVQTGDSPRVIAHACCGTEPRDRLGRRVRDAQRRAALVRELEAFLEEGPPPDLAGLERQYTQPVYGDPGERRARGRKAFDALRLSDLCAELIACLAGERIPVQRVEPLGVSPSDLAAYRLTLGPDLTADELSAAIIALHAEVEWRQRAPERRTA